MFEKVQIDSLKTVNQFNMKNNHKLYAAIVSAVMMLMLAIPAQAQLTNLHFGSYSITSIRPQSFTSVSGSVKVTVTNDTTSFVMQDISGKIYKLGTPMVQGHAADVYVPRGLSEVSVSGEASLCEGVGIWTILRCLIGFNINDYTADVSMTVTDEKGHVRTFTEEGMSVAAILNNLRARKRK